MVNELIQQILAIITLIFGGALIIFIYDAYRVVKEYSLLLFIYGLFTLVIGLVIPDIIMIFWNSAFIAYWAAVFSRILEIIGIGAMIFAVLR